MSECAFCDIVKRESDKQETEPWWPSIAFDPIGPHAPGHKLIVPRTHIADATDDPYLASITFASAVKYANRHVRGPVNFITSVGADATQSVFHLHIHVIPRGPQDALPKRWPWLGAESAEAEVERLREGIRALADDYEMRQAQCHEEGESTEAEGDTITAHEWFEASKVYRGATRDLRALLSPSPAATTGEAGLLHCHACNFTFTPTESTAAGTLDPETCPKCTLDEDVEMVAPPVSSGEACCMAGTPLAGPGVTHEVGCTRPAPVSSDKARDPASPCRCHPADDDSGHCGGWMPPAPVVTPSAEGSEP